MEPISKLEKKTHKSRNDTAVQGTNDHSIVSKLSAVNLGYTQDNFLQFVVARACRRAPLINKGYYIRAKVMEHAFHSFLGEHKDRNQVISLGSGFDTSYFRLLGEGLLDNSVYFEIDFPDLMQRKLSLINSQSSLKYQIHNLRNTTNIRIILDSSHYKLLGVDMCDIQMLEQTLVEAGLDVNVPTLLVSEVSITYMTPENSSRVIEWASKFIHNAVFLTYEQINPDDAFGQSMLLHFTKIGSRLKCIDTYPSMRSQIRRYHNLGWPCVKASDLVNFYYHHISPIEKQRTENLEPFDEYEAWHLKCTHYMVLTAFKGCCITLADQVLFVNNTGEQVGVLMDTRNLADVTHVTQSTTAKCIQNIDTYLDEIITSNDTFNGCFKRFGHSCNVVCLSQMEPSDSHSNSVIRKCEIIASTCSSGSSPEHPVDSPTDITVNKYIVCMGGFGNEQSNHGRLKYLHVVSFQSGEPVPVEYSGDICRFDRMYHTSVLLSDDKILLFGGRFSPTQPCDCDISLLTLTEDLTSETHVIHCKCKHLTPIGDVPCPRWRHTATVLLLDNKEYVLVYGGRTPTGTLDDLYILDTNSWIWTGLHPNGNGPESRHSHTADVWRNGLVVACGLDASEVPQSSVHHLCCIDSIWSWNEIKVDNLRARYSQTCAVVDDTMILVGGVSLDYPPPGITLISLETGALLEYNQLELCEPARSMMLHNHESVVDDGQLIIIGGGGNCFSFGTHLNDISVVVNINQLNDLMKCSLL